MISAEVRGALRDRALAYTLVAHHAERVHDERQERARSVAALHRQHLAAYRAAEQGREPAEALPQYLRWQLVEQLHGQGMTDLAIALWTRQTLYTVARIRRELGLAPNQRDHTRILTFPTGDTPATRLPTTTYRSA